MHDIRITDGIERILAEFARRIGSQVLLVSGKPGDDDVAQLRDLARLINFAVRFLSELSVASLYPADADARVMRVIDVWSDWGFGRPTERDLSAVLEQALMLLSDLNDKSGAVVVGQNDSMLPCVRFDEEWLLERDALLKQWRKKA